MATGKKTYTPELAATICERLAAGESLRSICRDEGMPDERTVRRWVIDDVDGFAPHYTQARDTGLDAIADEIFDIVDEGRNDWVERENARTGETYVALNEEAISRARLRFDARRWYLSKLAPKRYGDKLAVGGADDLPPIQLDSTEREKKLMALLATAQARKDAADLV